MKLHLTFKHRPHSARAQFAVGTSLSAFWILSLNAWMQAPTGFSIVDGVFHVDSLHGTLPIHALYAASFPAKPLHFLTNN
jgi:cytochrome d ubiquinol oxidase subunit I